MFSTAPKSKKVQSVTSEYVDSLICAARLTKKGLIMRTSKKNIETRLAYLESQEKADDEDDEWFPGCDVNDDVVDVKRLEEEVNSMGSKLESSSESDHAHVDESADSDKDVSMDEDKIHDLTEEMLHDTGDLQFEDVYGSSDINAFADDDSHHDAKAGADVAEDGDDEDEDEDEKDDDHNESSNRRNRTRRRTRSQIKPNAASVAKVRNKR